MILVWSICKSPEPANRSWNTKRIDLPESKALNRQRVFVLAISTSIVHNRLHGLIELLFRDTDACFFSRFVTSRSFNEEMHYLERKAYPLSLFH